MKSGVVRLMAPLGCGFAAFAIVVVQSPAGAAQPRPIVVGDMCSCSGPETSTIARTSAVLQAVGQVGECARRSGWSSGSLEIVGGRAVANRTCRGCRLSLTARG